MTDGLEFYGAVIVRGGLSVHGPGTRLVGGAVVGNVAERVARDLGASEPVAQGVGALGAAGGGAAVGALIGSVIPGVGTAVGAGVGAVAGLIGYGLSKLF